MSAAAVDGSRRALVTGATQGIGRAVAECLARHGWNLTIAGRRRVALDEAARAFAAAGAEVEAVEADLAHRPDLDRLARAVKDAGRLDLLVHAAGLFAQAPWTDAGDEAMPLMAVNYEAPARLTGALVPLLRASRGHVVFVNSTQGLKAGPETGAYAASKAALRALADSLRGAVARFGVRVTSIFPGSTATPMQERIQRDRGRTYSPSDFMAPEDVATMVLAASELPAKLEVGDIIMRPMPPFCPTPQEETSRP
jgi:short-subunit dehydrogenase